MIPDGHFDVGPWSLTESQLDFDLLAQAESIFALSNGHIGLRGNLDEGEPVGIPGTYLAGFYETRPLPYAEAGYGYPESGQTVVNATNGKILRLLVDDEPFDVRYGTLHSHIRTLDLRSGTLRRRVEWSSPAGRRIEVTSTRIVSFTQRAIAAVDYEVKILGDPHHSNPARVIVQSELVANEEVPHATNDPRVSAMLDAPLQAEQHGHDRARGLLVHRTKVSGLRIAAAYEHVIECPTHNRVEAVAYEDLARYSVATLLPVGETLRVTKLIAYGWSATRSVDALVGQVTAAISGAKLTGWDDLVREQREYLDDFWDGADVELSGDEQVQLAVRLGLFHTLQAGARTERRAIAAKGLTGPGYDGHAFWDTEMFILPVLSATHPAAAADALRWRASILPVARERAATLHHTGAVFPWRTIHGEECSGYWPAGTAAMHVNADIADAVRRYLFWTDDDDFARETGIPLTVETARLWMSLGVLDAQGRFHINGVTGPDEYSALADDNVFTNTMAASNLRTAADLCSRWVEAAEALDVTPGEADGWRQAAEGMHLPRNDTHDIYEQSRDFTRRQVWDFASAVYPLLLHAPYFDLYRKQVIKQADLMLAMHWQGQHFSLEDKARAFAYYEPLTVRDSSLSASTQAILAAEVGHLDLAHDYLLEAALMDLRDLEHNTRDGLHIASLAGSWLACVAGFGGMRDHGEALHFAPSLPPGITAMTFNVKWRDLRLRVQVGDDVVTLALRDGLGGPSLPFTLYDEKLVLAPGDVIQRDLRPQQPLTPRPSQPPGRAPMRSGSLGG